MMAEKRMFSRKITQSDDFLAMPHSAQNLYFHLNLEADDEGFVNSPKKVMRIINANDDDLKLIIYKHFVIAFESGVIVIKHWRMHNVIRADRLKNTDYAQERALLSVKDNGSYTLKKPQNDLMADICQTGDGQMTGECPHRLDKIRLDKDRLNILPEKSVSGEVYKQRFEEFWKAYPKKKSKGYAEKAFYRIKPTAELQKQILDAIQNSKQSEQWQKDNGQFIPHPATWLNSKGWEDELEQKQSGIESSFDTDEFFEAALKRSKNA